MLLLVLQGVFRGLGDTQAVLYATLVATGVNVVLDPVLIYQVGWGVAGAAVATGTAEVWGGAGVYYAYVDDDDVQACVACHWCVYCLHVHKNHQQHHQHHNNSSVQQVASSTYYYKE